MTLTPVSSMRLTPHSFNGFLFQQGKRVSCDFLTPHDWSIQNAISANNTDRNQNFPKYSGKVFGGGVKVVRVNLNDVDVDRNDLVAAMDVKGDQQIPLYALDELGQLWYCNVVCTGLNTETVDGKTAVFGYIFDADDPTWTMNEETTDSWTATADLETHDIMIDCNQDVEATFEIMPVSSVPGYYPYKNYIKNYNPIASAQSDGIDITGAGGWNHAALVTDGKSLASGADVLIFMDGAQIPFWIGGGGWNSTTARLFISQTWKPGQFMPLKTAIANTGTPTYIEWAVTADVKKALSKLPRKGIVRVNNEEFSYKNLSNLLCRAEIVERTIRGTSIAAHAAGDITWWVEHDIKVVYGYADAVAPTYPTTKKPVFVLTSSTITSRVYNGAFADPTNLRAGAWKRLVVNDGIGKLNRVYSGNHASATEVNPALTMGMEIASYQSQGRARPETAELAWIFYHPAEPTVISSNGEKFRSFTGTTWPAKAELASSPDGVKYVQEWNLTTPSVANTWETWSNAAEALPSGTRFIKFHFAGSINAAASNFQRMEVDALTITLDSTKVIQVGMNGEISSYHFTIEVENMTTDEKFGIDYPVTQDRKITINTEDYEVTYRGMNALRAISFDSIRARWLHLKAGVVNRLRYRVYSVTGNVSITTKYHKKGL